MAVVQDEINLYAVMKQVKASLRSVCSFTDVYRVLTAVK